MSCDFCVHCSFSFLIGCERWRLVLQLSSAYVMNESHRQMQTSSLQIFPLFPLGRMNLILLSLIYRPFCNTGTCIVLGGKEYW